MKLWNAIALVIVLWAALFLPYLGSHEVRGEEPRRILPARTMLQNGDFIVPRVGGEIYSRKPPLINWSIAGMFQLTGDNVWSARFPSILWLLAFALTAIFALRNRYGIWPATTAGLFFLTCFGVLDKGRMAEIEAMYVAQTGIAFLLWFKWWTEDRRWLAYTIPWLFLGLGLLAKGPVHLLFFYPVILATLWKAGRWKEAFHPAHLLGILLMIGVFAPWAYLNLQRVGSPEETSGIWIQQLMERLALDQVDIGGWLVRPFEMAKDFLPWTILLVWAWWKTAKAGALRSGEDESELEVRLSNAMWGARFGLMFGFVLIALAPKGEARYVMPIFPIAAVVLVDLLSRVRILDAPAMQKIESWWHRANRWVAILVAALAVIAIGIAPLLGAETPLSHAVSIALLAAITVTMLFRNPKWPPLVGSSLVFACAIALTFAYSTPLEKEHGNYRPVAADLQRHLTEPDQLLAFYDPENLRFLVYLHHPYVESARVQDLPENPGYLAIETKDLKLQKIQRYLEPFSTEAIEEFEWERKEFVLLRLRPKP